MDSSRARERRRQRQMEMEMEMEEQAVLEHQRGYLRHHERVQNIVEQQIRDSLNLHHARLQEQGHARRQREQERRYEEERRYEREQAWQPQALRRDQQLEDERRVHRFMHQKNLQEQNPNPIPKPTPKPKQEPLMKQEPKQKPTPKPTPKPKQEQVPQQQKPQQKPQQEQKQKQKQKQKKPQDQNQDQQQPLTIADLCQQCNLHFCDVLHHVAIIAKASKSQPSSNHKGYKHDDLVGAYSTFRHACQRLNAHGREEEAVERRITQDPEFFVSNLKLALKSVVKALEEFKPVITKQVEKQVLNESIIKNNTGPERAKTLQAQLNDDPDLAWFETFMTESSLRCIIKGTNFFEEISKTVRENLKKR